MLIKCTSAQLEKTRNETKNEHDLLLKKFCAEHFQLSQEETNRMLETFSEEELDELRELLKKKSAKHRRNVLAAIISPIPTFFSLGFLPVVGTIFFAVAVATAVIEMVLLGMEGERLLATPKWKFYPLCKRYEKYFPKHLPNG